MIVDRPTKAGQYNGMKWVRYYADPAIRDDAPASARLCRDPHYRGQNLYSAAFVAELKKRNMPNDGNFWSISESMPFLGVGRIWSGKNVFRNG
jgi:hypothetical protein